MVQELVNWKYSKINRKRKTPIGAKHCIKVYSHSNYKLFLAKFTEFKNNTQYE